MSIQTPATGNDFFTLLPPEMMDQLFSYLRGTGSEHDTEGAKGDRAIVLTSAVCRDWRNHSVLQFEREQASSRLKPVIDALREYPIELIEVFNRCQLSIARLPRLQGIKMSKHDQRELSNRWLQSLSTELPCSIMKYQTVSGSGIILKLCQRNGGYLIAMTISRYWSESDPQRGLESSGGSYQARLSSRVWSVNGSDFSPGVALLPDNIDFNNQQISNLLSKLLLGQHHELMLVPVAAQNNTSIRPYVITAIAVASVALVIGYLVSS